MPNTRALNSFALNNSLAINERTTVTDPTLVGPLPSVVNVGNQFRLNGTSSPPVTMTWHQQVTLPQASSGSSSSSSSSSSSGSSGGGIPAGQLTLDLTALPDPVLTTVNALGLKLRVLHSTGGSGNQAPMTIQPGISNGYPGWATGLIVNPNDVQTLLLNGTIAIDATHKTIDLAGDAGDTTLIAMGFG